MEWPICITKSKGKSKCYDIIETILGNNAKLFVLKYNYTTIDETYAMLANFFL